MKKIYAIMLAAGLACACAFTGTPGISMVFGGVNVTGNCSEEGIDFSEERNVGYFESFKVSGPFNTYFIQSDETRIVVEGKEEFVKKLQTVVKGDELEIKLEKGTYRNLVLKVTVYAPSIEEMAISGSGDLICGEINLPLKDLEIAGAGSGDIRLSSVVCKELEIASAGSGDVKILTLSAEDLSVAMAGSGDAHIESALVRDEVELSVAGSGDITINGSCRKLEASTAGSGDISGSIKYGIIEKKSVGSGKIRL